MRQPSLHLPILLAIIVTVAGCGGTTSNETQATPSTSTSTTPRDTAATLEQAVRRAISENHALLTEALVTNRVAASPEGTAGPALADVRRSAAQRKAQGVRVRILSESFRVLAVQLDPSYTTASATILNTQRVQPIYRRRRGTPSASREHVRLELHRIGDTERFVVWKVTPI